MKGLRILLLILVPAVTVLAQQDPQFTQYMFNNLYFNPAHAGIEGITRVTALHRTQWLGYQPTFEDGGAPSTQLMTFSSPLYKLNSGIGAYISNDRLGPLNNVEIQASYAYHLALGGGKLSAGIRTGIYSQTINFDRYRAVSPDDPLINTKGKASQGRPDLAVGLNYRTEKYYLGFSSVHLLPSSFDFGLNQNSRLKPHYYLSGGYFYELNFDVKFQLMTLIKSDFAKTAFDFGGMAYIKDTMWAGLSFRESEAAILLLGYSLMKDKSLKIGYALDYIVNDQAVKQATSHEIMLTYELPVATAMKKKVVRTPRYRH
ncbi:MAG: type IX secretion system membrane protein PorP/SprF [Bacteroidetes bacterium]|nr:type IX secretion system membrane protein PorP/SprF [Bacteroidota bacterium]